jgi:localization factor PodJL
MYELGEGVSQDFSKAAEWYERAAQQGLTVAQLQLSILHGTGRLGERDLVQSYKWVLLAAHLGNEKTEELRGLLEKEMTDAERVEAVRLARAYRPVPVFEEVRPLRIDRLE